MNEIPQLLDSAEGGKVTVDLVKSQLKKKFSVDVDDILGEDSDYDFGRKLAEDFIQRTGLRSFPQALLNGIPLPQKHITVEDFEEVVLQQVITLTPSFQKAIYRGKLTDKDEVIDYIMNQPNVMPRLNERILNTEESSYLDMSGTGGTVLDVQRLIQLSLRDMTATAMDNLKYFSLQRKSPDYHSLTYWVVGDLDCPESRKLLLAALKHLVRS